MSFKFSSCRNSSYSEVVWNFLGKIRCYDTVRNSNTRKFRSAGDNRMFGQKLRNAQKGMHG